MQDRTTQQRGQAWRSHPGHVDADGLGGLKRTTLEDRLVGVERKHFAAESLQCFRRHTLCQVIGFLFEILTGALCEPPHITHHLTTDTRIEPLFGLPCAVLQCARGHRTDVFNTCAETEQNVRLLFFPRFVDWQG